MNELSSRLQAAFQKTRKVCFGRFLMEIPATATVIYGPTEVEAPIIYHKAEAIRLAEHLNQFLTEAEQEKRFLLKSETNKFPLLGKVIEGVKPGQKIAYGSKDQVNYDIHSFIPVKDDLFILKFMASPDEDDLSTINQIASLLRSRNENEIPAEAGMCIEGGFIPLENKYERATIGIRMAEFPDAHLSVDVHKNFDHIPNENSPRLLREQAKELAEADGLGAVFAKTKILRQRDRQLSSWNGEELALRTPAYKNEKSVHDFRFHSPGVANDRLHPELDIRFDSGLKGNAKASVDPSLTDQEALELWDKLITTIRLRQPSDATPTTAAAPRVPLASVVPTGQTCPQTGWWVSNANKKLESNRRRLIKAGETMPLILLSENGFWQKLTKQPSMRQIATVWQLVQYDDEIPPSIDG